MQVISSCSLRVRWSGNKQREETPVHLASSLGHLEIVKALIDGRANLEAKAKVSAHWHMHLLLFSRVSNPNSILATAAAHPPHSLTPTSFQ